MNVDSFEYNEKVEEIVNVIMARTQNHDPHFFRAQVNYFLTLVPSSLNIRINSPIVGNIPINSYTINLLSSGSGKGFSTGILEGEMINRYKNEFMVDVYPKYANNNINLLALNRAINNNTTEQEEHDLLTKEFKGYGAYKFTFEKGTEPAIKQIRNKLILSNIGSINIIVDEIGMNLAKLEDSMGVMLELYDTGKTRDKLTKNTKESTRYDELDGSVPTNMLLFGAPSKLLDDGINESNFMKLLETGYARRCFFSYSEKKTAEDDLTPKELYALINANSGSKVLESMSVKLAGMANATLANGVIDLPEDVGIELLKYKQWCATRASELPDHATIQKHELEHRYFKALKLAGVYCFLEGSMDISQQNLNEAIKFTEDSGEALEKLLHRDKPYERLARYIAYNSGTELTQVDLHNNLPFFKGTKSDRDNMIAMAIAWGYKNNIIIRKSYKDSIEFLSGETLQPIDLENCILAHSEHWSSDYLNSGENYKFPFFKLDQLLTHPSNNWINHRSKNGNRKSEDMEEGFNLIALDIDSGISLEEAKILMNEYSYIIHTTKRHRSIDPETGKEYGDRFRMVIPMNYTLKLDEDEYRQFMENVADWLPFNGLDKQTFQRNRKWSTYDKAEVYINEGKLLDITPFIPRTSRNEEYKKLTLSLGSMDNLERWFASRMEVGSRNNILVRFGFMLLDAGVSLDEAKVRVLEFNGKLHNPLDESEILSTIFQSLQNRVKNN